MSEEVKLMFKLVFVVLSHILNSAVTRSEAQAALDTMRGLLA